VRTRGLFEVEREGEDVMPRSSLLPLFTGVRGRGILRSLGRYSPHIVPLPFGSMPMLD
jgi:hypothetical protein